MIGENEIVLCDFGGTMDGYCSDITRCVFTGDVATAAPEIAEAYEVLHTAQQAAVSAATVGTPCEDVDRTARGIIADAGYGDYFVHRTGHGIGMEEHEDPYIVEGNTTPLADGHAFSVEPGIYVPGRWGMRLEDIVIATDDGPSPRTTPITRWRASDPSLGEDGPSGRLERGQLDADIGTLVAREQAHLERAVGRRTHGVERARRASPLRTVAGWPAIDASESSLVPMRRPLSVWRRRSKAGPQNRCVTARSLTRASLANSSH